VVLQPTYPVNATDGSAEYFEIGTIETYINIVLSYVHLPTVADNSTATCLGLAGILPNTFDPTPDAH